MKMSYKSILFKFWVEFSTAFQWKFIASANSGMLYHLRYARKYEALCQMGIWRWSQNTLGSLSASRDPDGKSDKTLPHILSLKFDVHPCAILKSLFWTKYFDRIIVPRTCDPWCSVNCAFGHISSFYFNDVFLEIVIVCSWWYSVGLGLGVRVRD